jgi:hypothetical protein
MRDVQEFLRDTPPGGFRRYNCVAETPAVTNSAHAKSFDQSPLPRTRLHDASRLALACSDEKERVPCRYRGSFRMHRSVERRPAAGRPPDCDEPGALEPDFLEPWQLHVVAVHTQGVWGVTDQMIEVVFDCY